MSALLLSLMVAASQPSARVPEVVPQEAPVVEAPAPVERKSLRLAVYELKVDGVDERIGRVVTDAVVDELRKLQRVSVVSMDEVRAMLDVEAQKQLVGCGDDSCIAEIADSLGVDGVIIGSLSKIGDEHVFGMRRIDQRQASTLGQVTQRLKAEDGQEFLAMIGPSVEELFPEHALREGQTRGVAPGMALRLNPPPLQPWVFWTTTAAAGTLGVAAGASLAVNLVLFEQVKSREALTAPQSGKELLELRGQNDLAAISTIGLGALATLAAGAAGAVSMFTDWNGDAEASGE